MAEQAWAAPRFVERSREWGIEFRHHTGASGRFFLPETFGSGVVLFDYDSDGDLDAFFVDSGVLPGAGTEGEPGRSVLFRNDGGVFVDVTKEASLLPKAYGMGAVAADIDGDRDVDLFVTAYGSASLWRNLGDGRFEDATAGSGLGSPGWSTSAAFADVDADRDLDLYVAHYVLFSLQQHPLCGETETGLRSYCHPSIFPGLPDRFYRNRGDGTFDDATGAAGFAADDGKGLGVIFGDIDLDGWPDLYVANDTTPNFLYRNRGDGTFEDISLLSGTALNAEGKAEAGMGVDLLDLDRDALPEIVVTNFDLETNGLYGNLGGGIFFDRRFVAKIAEPSLYKVGFGVAFADFDLDGDADLAIANGHILDNIERFPDKKGNTYKQENQILENQGGGIFSWRRDAGLTVVRSSRGLAVGDLDLDGDGDLLISNSNDLAEVYENLSEASGHWLALDLGGPGVVANVTAGARRQTAETRTASSYLSQNEPVLRFGLGVVSKVDAIELRWPGGHRRRLTGASADAVLVLPPPR